MWFIILLGLMGLGTISRNTEEIAKNIRDWRYIQAHGQQAFDARERRIKRMTSAMFWGIVAALLLWLGGCAPRPVTYTNVPSSYAGDPCAGLPVAMVGDNDPWHACRTRATQQQARQKVDQDNQFLHEQWAKAERDGICNGYNGLGCIPPDQRPAPMSEEYVLQHGTELDYVNCGIGNTYSCQSLANRHFPPIPTH